MPPKAAAAPKKEEPKPKKAEAPKKEEAKPAAKAATKAEAPKPKTAAAKAEPKPAAKAAEAPKPVEKKTAGPSNGVHVKNWGSDGVEGAKLAFATCGKVLDARIRRNKFALVYFDSAAAVKKAIDTFNGKAFKGRVLTVTTAKVAPKASKTENSKTIFVSPIFSASTTRKDVITHFAKFGKVIRLRTYRQNYAFVYFDSSAAAQKAVKETNGQSFRGRTVIAKLSVRSLEGDKKKEERRQQRITVFRKVKDVRKKAIADLAAKKKKLSKSAGGKPVVAKVAVAAKPAKKTAAK